MEAAFDNYIMLPYKTRNVEHVIFIARKAYRGITLRSGFPWRI